MASRLRMLIAELEAEERAQKGGNSFANHGNGNQNYAAPNTNNGAYSGNGNSHHITNNHGSGPTINNSGQFNGHGNGGFFHGNFDASTRNYGF
ncbi:hypothetical protein HN51_065512 [Arachis hypogaea]|nr:uncharacterized protein LOC107483432 [Arachis duranensis]XP_025646499.1 aspartate and glycine-rich protein [Arachis hypogaea]XP_025694529.1 aspartate and glycine-rich protein [Arachis hypogaea]XP_057754152.1 uncharacterized protein LOC130973574 [Arachis stenosperma]QHO37744.1 uncharacterized protein DS421_4g114190 [Arachis hypogaea]RYR12772.1 hypothetical protein Ahy_B04g070137 isoform A [Arachis hypogaea]